MTTQEQNTNRSAWSAARKSCKSIQDRTTLGKVIERGWQPHELAEYARILFHVPGYDRATPSAYKSAIHSAASGGPIPEGFLRDFRERGGIPVPPRDHDKLVSKKPPTIARQFYRDWPGHTDELRNRIDDLARAEHGWPKTRYVTPAVWRDTAMKHFELAPVD